MIFEISPDVRGVLLVISLILCFAQIFCVIDLSVQRRGLQHLILSGVLLFLGYVLFELQESIARRSPEDPLPAFARINALFLYGALVILAFLTVWELVAIFYQSRGHMSPDTVRESINLLPTGLCFCDADGSVLLSNRVMEDICLTATGEALLNANTFWEAVGKKPFLTLSDGSTWSLDRRILSTEMGEVYQITASDITKTHEMMQELKSEQEKLKEINRRLLAYGSQVSDLTRQEEILSAKIRVHDSLGECLLAAKRCILTPVGRKEKEETLRLWHQSITLLEVPPEDEKSDGLKELLKAAGAVGVKVVFAGSLPPAGSVARELTEAAIHACVTNTVRHAHGTRLFVVMKRDGTTWTIRCTNNGDAPKGEIHEGGGLTGLRRRVEKEGGSMRVESTPRFALILCVEEGGLS